MQPKLKPRHPEFSKNTSGLATLYTSVPDLRRPRVGVHGGQFQLSGGARALGEGRVADEVAEGLSVEGGVRLVETLGEGWVGGWVRKDEARGGEAMGMRRRRRRRGKHIPFGLKLLKHLSLRMVPYIPCIHETSQIQLLCSELRHFCFLYFVLPYSLILVSKSV